LNLPDTPPPQLTEAIQHGIFKYGIIPTAFYGLLAGIMWYNHRKHPDDSPHAGEERGATSMSSSEEGGR
jgi:choline-glycine betaine transporter